MGFLSFHEAYYTAALARLEGGTLDAGGIYEAKQLLKYLDDLRDLLGAVRADKILVVESGYCGTVPLTLAALDDRVDFRLYTTAPYLFEIYRDKIFCRRYEQIRAFETLRAQDALTQFSALRDGRFFVKTAADDEIWQKAAAEAAALLAARSGTDS